MLGELFSVYQFFEDGSSEQVRQLVSAEDAVTAAHHYCSNVAANCGITRRVIITESGDSIAFEWQYGKGVTFK